MLHRHEQSTCLRRIGSEEAARQGPVRRAFCLSTALFFSTTLKLLPAHAPFHAHQGWQMKKYRTAIY